VNTISRILGLGVIVALLGIQCVATTTQEETTTPEKGYSHVRIVRLSFVDGTVLVKRPNATQWAKALVNTPIEQGFTLATSNGSYAEAQFENGSTARLGQGSRLDFAELALTPKGDKINHLVFDQGYGTFNFTPKHEDQYWIQAGNSTIMPRGKSEFRVDLDQNSARVEVFDGSVEVKTPERKVDLGKGKVLTYTSGTEEALNESHGIQEDAWDKWVHARDQQTELALNDSAVGMNSPVFGWSDLDQYGDWAMFPGYGYGWAPYEPMGWSPFSMGMWSFYPGMGYTWISGEPWGWLPFHYGLWNYDPTFGYFWMPGAGGFNTFYPGLVDWYGGPGYIGWAPMGAGGRPVCTAANCITAVRRSTIQRGEFISAATRVPVRAGQILRPMSSPNITPSALAQLSGRPITNGAVVPRMGTQQVAPRMAAFSRPAPKILSMGQTPVQAAKEMRTLTAHRSFFSRAFSGEKAQTVQARLGNTLGGRYELRGANGLRAMSGGSQARYEGGRMMRAPMLLQHSSAMGFSHPMARMGGDGGIRASAGPSGEVGGRMGDGGFHGSPGMSAGISQGIGSSAGHGVSAGGGGGHGH
jgi:hypothetical protein